MTEADFPMGARVTFADASATTSSGEPGVAVGVVNGDPVTRDGEVKFVPVFAARDNGRESTTVLVAIDNVLDVEVP